jgi:hypothetical protein
MRWRSLPVSKTVSLILISLLKFSTPESPVLSAVDTVVLALRLEHPIGEPATAGSGSDGLQCVRPAPGWQWSARAPTSSVADQILSQDTGFRVVMMVGEDSSTVAPSITSASQRSEKPVSRRHRHFDIDRGREDGAVLRTDAAGETRPKASISLLL